VKAFADLVAWVDYGIKPGGDDFSDPAVVASDDFGCACTRFTASDTPYPNQPPSPSNGGHVWAEACPSAVDNTVAAF
jgi:hypothetical protein